MLVKEYQIDKVYMLKLEAGSDLYDSLTEFTVNNDITSGEVFVMGLSRNAVFAYYDINSREYKTINRDDQYFEIIQCAGNISVRDGKPFVHLHVSFGDKEGNIIGGHLLPGTMVEVGEVRILSYKGEPMERVFDPEYNMAPWKK